jgi:hypothetical protein
MEAADYSEAFVTIPHHVLEVKFQGTFSSPTSLYHLWVLLNGYPIYRYTLSPSFLCGKLDGPDVTRSHQSTVEIEMRGILPLLRVLLHDVYKLKVSRHELLLNYV